MDRSAQVKSDPRRALPAVDRLCRAVRADRPELAHWAAMEGSRAVLEEERSRLAPESPGEVGRAAEPVSDAQLVARAGLLGERLAVPHPTRVVNATGVVLHTNLGRAPLAAGAAEAAAAAAAAYSDLELDLETGRRGRRSAAVEAKLERLTGAPAALVVNNNAAALLLALSTLARGREVIVSRGELVEIGGSFRVPEIMERAGVSLVEVGSTNRTHPEDYARAIGPETALLLKVHRSNFSLRGFVAEVSLGELAQLAKSHGLPVVEDLGSGTLVDLSAHGLPAEVFAPGRLRLGADVVCFSGDKLLGGPQAGIVLGSVEALSSMRSDPLARALRLDKLSLAALDWTLVAFLEGRAERDLPVLRQLLEPLERLETRAKGLAQRLAKAVGAAAQVAARPDRAAVGGGSLPEFELDTWVVTVRSGERSDRLAARLRGAAVPVLGRVRDELLVLDVRTLLADDEAALESAVVEAVAAAPRATDGRGTGRPAR